MSVTLKHTKEMWFFHVPFSRNNCEFFKTFFVMILQMLAIWNPGRFLWKVFEQETDEKMILMITMGKYHKGNVNCELYVIYKKDLYLLHSVIACTHNQPLWSNQNITSYRRLYTCYTAEQLLSKTRQVLNLL